MDSMRSAVEDYLRLRRALGFQLNDPERHLRDFLRFMESRRALCMTTALAIEWAGKPTVTTATRAERLRAIRLFAKYYSGIEPATEIPPEGVFPHRTNRAMPHIYSQNEVAAILQAAANLSHRSEFTRQTVVTVLATLSVTGMRISEVLALNQDDVDFGEAIIHVHRSKFGKSRLVPVHPSTASALAEYTLLRDQVTTRANTTTNAFFVTETGRRAYQQTIRHAFVRITKQVGMRGLRATSGPRLHDFRHTFAVNTLIHWYRRGLDAERELPKLSTYLGHRHWSDTYWYLTAVPELMCLATRRLERAFGGLS